MSDRTFRYVTAVLFVVVLWAAMFWTASLAYGARLTFTTPEGVADSTCATLPGIRIGDLAAVNVYQRPYAGTDTTWTFVQQLAVTDERGGERMVFEWEPSAPGWWEITVRGITATGLEGCPSNAMVLYGNPCRPARIIDLRPEP